MIPLRVRLAGFMSYRDETDLSFDGASLWVLSGGNGAGKSTVFDGITFALYGLHRAGKSNPRALINHQADRLLVEFDFANGQDIYRVKRTLSRRGQPSRQAFYLAGPNPPRPGQALPQSVPETDTDVGFKRWVQEVVGLDEQTFTACVLLQQGRSEAMLEADPRDRHDMLKQLVDLSAYDRLLGLADRRHKEFDDRAKAHQKELTRSAAVDEGAITDLALRIKARGNELAEVRGRLEHLAALKVHATSWATLQARREAVARQLAEARDLFTHSEQIERDAARLAELNRVLPQLQRLQSDQQRLAGSVALLAQYGMDAEQLGKGVTEARALRDRAAARLARLTQWQERASSELTEAQEEQLFLDPEVRKLDALRSTRLRLNELGQQLGRFPSDLDEQIQALQREVAQLAEMNSAYPWLRQFATLRANWHDARSKGAKERRTIARRAKWLVAIEEEREIYSGLVSDSETEASRAKEELTRAETLLDNVAEQVERLAQVAGQATCSYCGQPLAEEHLLTERERLEGILAERQGEVESKKLAHEAHMRRHVLLQRRVRRLSTTGQKVQEQEQLAKERLRSTEQDGVQIEAQVVAILGELAVAYRGRIMPESTTTAAACLEAEYPTDVELSRMQQQGSRYELQNALLSALRQRVGERNTLLEEHNQASCQIQDLVDQYSAEREQDIRACHRWAGSVRERARKRLERLVGPLQRAEQVLESAQQEVGRIAAESGRVSERARPESGRRQELERIVGERLLELPGSWRPIGETLTAQEMEGWQAEALGLSGADTRLQALETARAQQGDREQALERIQGELDQIPPAGRCVVGQLEEAERDARTKEKDVEGARRALEHEKQKLEMQRDRRQEVEAQLREAVQQAYLHKELARLLGRDSLQRHLLHRAETRIVRNANEVLDRISGGRLRLELRTNDDAGGRKQAKGKPKSQAKALDLVAFNSDTGTKAIPVAFLSGSQRFRVAVSLVLGIGQFTDHGARRVESVIIDEGFGGLDKEGRREVIDELHLLKDILQRIILVSHQLYLCSFRRRS